MHLMLATRDAGISPGVVDALYADALLLADEARTWFDRARGSGSIIDDAAHDTCTDAADPLFHWAGRHDPSLRIALACESLRLTTRLMHVIAWLLMRRAVHAGELSPAAALAEHNRLGPSPACDRRVHSGLPAAARALIDASIALHARVAALDAAADGAVPGQHPVHRMRARLESAL